MTAALPSPIELADYLADFYGTCATDPCACNRPGPWRGRACPNWRPCVARAWGSFATWGKHDEPLSNS
jgi:hypothetical protein